MNLIEKVGGIERAKAIVGGAPDNTADAYVADIDTYFSFEFGSYFDHGEEDWRDSDYRNLSDLQCDYEVIFLLSELCVAIKQHEQGSNASEFKVGDLVVKSKYDRGPVEVVAIQGDQLILGKHSRVAVSKKSVRHADHPVQDHEVIELSGNTGGLETAEMIDYSPMCEVIDK